MEAKAVKEAIEASHRTIEEWAVSIKVSREHLTRLLNREGEFPKKYLTRLKTIGLQFPDDVTKSDQTSAEFPGAPPALLEMAINFFNQKAERLEELYSARVGDLKDTVSDLRKTNDAHVYNTKNLTDANKNLSEATKHAARATDALGKIFSAVFDGGGFELDRDKTKNIIKKLAAD